MCEGTSPGLVNDGLACGKGVQFRDYIMPGFPTDEETTKRAGGPDAESGGIIL